MVRFSGVSPRSGLPLFILPKVVYLTVNQERSKGRSTLTTERKEDRPPWRVSELKGVPTVRDSRLRKLMGVTNRQWKDSGVKGPRRMNVSVSTFLKGENIIVCITEDETCVGSHLRRRIFKIGCGTFLTTTKGLWKPLVTSGWRSVLSSWRIWTSQQWRTTVKWTKR